MQLINWMIEQGLVHNDPDDPAARDIALWVRRYRDVETRVAVPQTVNGMRRHGSRDRLPAQTCAATTTSWGTRFPEATCGP